MPESTRFPGYDASALPPARERGPLFTDSPSLADVRRSFSILRERGEQLSIWDGGLFPEFRYTRVNIGRKGRARNHFQGIQRLRDGKHLVISGGDVNQPASHVFIARMGSCQNGGAWGCNLVLSREPSLNDAVIRTISFDRELWHGGGISVLGDVLAIPIEGTRDSRVLFVDLSDVERPALVGDGIARPDRKAGAVALARLRDGRFVCSVWWETGSRPRGRIDFYVSHNDDLFDGFRVTPVQWRYDGGEQGGPKDPAYQCINFVREERSGELYLIGTENGSDKSPIFAGPDRADLFAVEIRPNMSETAPPRLAFIASKRLFCHELFGNFDAAAGVYADADGELHLYSAYHWRMEDTIRMTEFSAELPARHAVVTDLDDAWIELFEHDRFRGRRLTIRGRRLSRLENYASIFVEGSNFENRVSSVRFQIPEGDTYRLFRDRDLRGVEAGRDFVDLTGTGRFAEIRDLAADLRFGDKVSSSCYLLDPII